MAPRKFESFAANSNFLAIVQPATKTNKAFVAVYSAKGGKRTQIWQATLSNPSSPYSVFLSDDGRYVVTLDNWGSVGYGDDVVALYSPKGQLAKYALEEFAPPPQARTNGWIERIKEKIEAVRYGRAPSTRMDYFNLFDHSTSSRWWNRDSIQFFAPPTNATHFCIWLDWDRRWVAWKLSDGSVITPAAKQTNEWNAFARQQCLKSILAGGGHAAEYNFLGRLRLTEDRPLIEAWLKDTEFGTGSIQSGSPEDSTFRFTLTSSSYKRQTAERILRAWDNGTNSPNRHDDQYRLLGTVEGRLRLPASPEGNQFLRIHLLPESASFSKPLFYSEHYLITEVEDRQPTDFRNGQIIRWPLGTNINFLIFGVTPGAYRIQALWDRARPMCESTNRVCQASSGDYISSDSPIVIVRKGQTNSPVLVDCKTLIE